MTSLTITLPDELAKVAEERGLLSPGAFEAYVRGQLQGDAENEVYPPGFDVRFKGAAAPELMGTVKYHGDIVAPLGVKWEADV